MVEFSLELVQNQILNLDLIFFGGGADPIFWGMNLIVGLKEGCILNLVKLGLELVQKSNFDFFFFFLGGGNLGPKKIMLEILCIQKNFGLKFFWVKKNRVGSFFGSEIFLGVKKNVGRNYFCHESSSWVEIRLHTEFGRVWLWMS